MAKEFKRSGSKDFKGKKPFNPTKGKKSSYGRSEDASSNKDFKSTNNKEFDSEKSFKSKKSRPDKRDEKPAFERFRDDSRPSDFGGSRSRTNFDKSDKKSFSEKTPFKKKNDEGDTKSSFKDRDENKSKSYTKKVFSDKPAFKKKFEGDEKPSFKDKGDDKRKPFSKKPFPAKPGLKKKNDDGNEKPSFREREERGSKPFGKTTTLGKSTFVRKSDEANPYDLNESDFEYGSEKPTYTSDSGRGFKKSKPSDKKRTSGKKDSKPQRDTDDGLVRLNKYLSNAGICSRREADVLISTGVVQVNGKTITEMGYRVKPTDIIKYGGQTLKKERLVYLILNKPKDYITTADDPQERRTVLELVQGACKERIYPVGRLDRATTGLLMFTNDGDLTKKLTHPRYGVRKIYHVELDKPLKRADLDKIAEGLELEDGPIKVDEVTYVGDGGDKTQVGVEIHSGKNRIVRRIFEHMGYNVRKLDRVMFGSLTKKDLPRGRWRILSDAEVGMLKMISAE